ncbi:nitroreductase family protein [Nocardioides sp. HM23]|uniref:nitroreductase family protein n=1 Tax=Nocardioides bizhenqiangii TaxID=3095076 RepID=UPI002ACA10E8|nr:nitroreductase family protein [Nocardioides sp. HM23]MDZ5619860.1 nitroreductase family protein [Nocardioides sp. HM23]
MEFSEVVRRRRMVRSYTDEPVDPAVVERALEHATRAPSAGFSQGWAFVVLDRPEDVRRFWTASSDAAATPDGRDTWLAGMMTAPVVVVPCSVKAAYLDRYAEPDKGWTDRSEERWPMPFWDLDTAMAALLILQTVTDAGLGACFFGIVPDRELEVRRALGLPDAGDPHPIGAITIGHPAPRGTGASGSAGRRRRTPWTDVAHRGRFGAGWDG